MKKKLKAISLFCGCGGADLGIIGGFDYLGNHYKSNHISIIHASDIDPKSVNTYNRNFKHKAICEDVLKLNFNDSVADIVIGGFPCQNFSTVNPNKNPEDRNNQLFWELTNIVSQVKPKAVIAENVKGFYYLKNQKYFLMVKNRLEELGYSVNAQILTAADYGIPQLRQRIIIVAIRNDLNKKYIFPNPTHGPNTRPFAAYIPLNAVIDTLALPDKKYYFSEKAVEGVKKAKNNMKRALAQDLSRPSLTITSHLAKVSLNSRDPVLLVDPSKELYRRFTPKEAARIQSFPDNFVFMGSEGDAYRQIGNAVPPVMMWHICNSLERILLNSK